MGSCRISHGEGAAQFSQVWLEAEDEFQLPFWNFRVETTPGRKPNKISHQKSPPPLWSYVWCLSIFLWGSLKTDYTFDDAHEVPWPQWEKVLCSLPWGSRGVQLPTLSWLENGPFRLSRCISYWRWGIFFQPAMLLYQFSKWWYEFRDMLDVSFNRLNLYPYLILLIDKILHQLADSFSHFLPGFKHTRWCMISSINSKNHSHRIHVWYIYLHLP